MRLSILHSIKIFLNLVSLQWVSAKCFFFVTLLVQHGPKWHQISNWGTLCETVYGSQFAGVQGCVFSDVKSPSNFRFRQKLKFILQNMEKLLNQCFWGKSVAEVRPPAVKERAYTFEHISVPNRGYCWVKYVIIVQIL